MRYYKRGFLNPEEGMAAFEAQIEIDNWEGKTHFYADGTFNITDCSRKISLDFGFSDEKGYHEVMTKLETLQEELREFQGYMVDAYLEMKDFERDKPKSVTQQCLEDML